MKNRKKRRTFDLLNHQLATLYHKNSSNLLRRFFLGPKNRPIRGVPVTNCYCNKIPPNPQDLLKSDFLNWTATLTNTDSPSYLPLHKRKWARLKDPKYRQNKRCHELLYTDHFGVMEKEGR